MVIQEARVVVLLRVALHATWHRTNRQNLVAGILPGYYVGLNNRKKRKVR